MIVVADNIHGLNPIVSEAMNRLDPEPIMELARKCAAAGAHYIDINPGYLSNRNLDRIHFLVETVQQAIDLPLILDSPNPRILAYGLAVCKKKPILNSISLDEAKLKDILYMAIDNKTKLVVLLMDEKSFSPASVEEKIALAIELRERAVAAGMPHDDLIFDPILPNMSWDDAYFRIAENIEFVRLVSSGAVFGTPALTMAGLSNLRSGRSLTPAEIETTCLSLLAGAGLNYILANVLRKEVQTTLKWVTELVK